MARVRVYPAAVADLAHHPGVRAHLHTVATYIADEASRRASFAEHHGGVIGAQEQDDGSWHVGWDDEHWYYQFHEFGSSHEPARPFLRPAADSVR